VTFASGVATDLGALGHAPATTNSKGFGINASGNVVGVSGTKANAPANTISGHAFFYNARTKKLIDLTPRAHISAGYAINNEGVITGSMDGTGFRATVDSHGVPHVVALPTPVGGSAVFALGINDKGEIVGYYTTHPTRHTTQVHPIAWINGHAVDLMSSIPRAYQRTGMATGINNHGQIVINAPDSQGHWHTLLLTPRV
jgi:uncharacterized membrane protein